jgi:hypothetical protein
MNCAELVETESSAFIGANNGNLDRPKPVLVSRREPSDWVTSRVIEVVNRQLENGNLPA